MDTCQEAQQWEQFVAGKRKCGLGSSFLYALCSLWHCFPEPFFWPLLLLVPLLFKPDCCVCWPVRLFFLLAVNNGVINSRITKSIDFVIVRKHSQSWEILSDKMERRMFPLKQVSFRCYLRIFLRFLIQSEIILLWQGH